MMQIDIQLSGRLQHELQQLTAYRLPQARENWTRTFTSRLLTAIRDATPRETGRAQAGWEAAADQLQSGAGSSSEHVDAGIGEGVASVQQEAEITLIAAVNQVPYVHYLEYGTSKMAPQAIVRRTLSQASAWLPPFPLSD